MKRVSLGLTWVFAALAAVAPACADDEDNGPGGSSSGGTAGSGTVSGGASGSGGSGGSGDGGPTFDVDCESLCETTIECAESANMAGAGGDGAGGQDLGECVRSCESSASTLPSNPCAAEIAEYYACSATVEPDSSFCIDGMLRTELACGDEFDTVIACQDD